VCSCVYDSRGLTFRLSARRVLIRFGGLVQRCCRCCSPTRSWNRIPQLGHWLSSARAGSGNLRRIRICSAASSCCGSAAQTPKFENWPRTRCLSSPSRRVTRGWVPLFIARSWRAFFNITLSSMTTERSKLPWYLHGICVHLVTRKLSNTSLRYSRKHTSLLLTSRSESSWSTSARFYSTGTGSKLGVVGVRRSTLILQKSSLNPFYSEILHGHRPGVSLRRLHP
jgi:hypothetical protein